MNATRLALFAVFGVAVLGTGFYITHRRVDAPKAPEPIVRADASGPQDAMYEIEGQKVTLAHGIHEAATVPGSAQVTTTRYFGNEAKGDLNGDSKDDVAFILTQSTGGSGTFYYLAAALGTDTGYQGLNTILLGDRVAPQATDIRAGVVAANFAVRKEGEPMTAAPSFATTTYAKVENGKLVQVSGR